jgi:hypothetical protein
MENKKCKNKIQISKRKLLHKEIEYINCGDKYISKIIKCYKHKDKKIYKDKNDEIYNDEIYSNKKIEKELQQQNIFLFILFLIGLIVFIIFI